MVNHKVYQPSLEESNIYKINTSSKSVIPKTQCQGRQKITAIIRLIKVNLSVNNKVVVTTAMEIS